MKDYRKYLTIMIIVVTLISLGLFMHANSKITGLAIGIQDTEGSTAFKTAFFYAINTILIGTVVILTLPLVLRRKCIINDDEIVKSMILNKQIYNCGDIYLPQILYGR